MSEHKTKWHPGLGDLNSLVQASICLFVAAPEPIINFKFYKFVKENKISKDRLVKIVGLVYLFMFYHLILLSYYCGRTNIYKFVKENRGQAICLPVVFLLFPVPLFLLIPPV